MLEYLKLVSGTFLGSGAVLAIARLVFDRNKEKRERTEATKYLALQLAILLEAYVIECAEGVSSHQTADEYDGHAGARLGTVLKLPDLPVGDAYRFLDPDLLNSVLAFPQRCLLAQRASEFWDDVVGDREAYYNTVKQNCLRMGSEALDISRALRGKYNLPGRSLRFDRWDIDNFIAIEMRKLTASLKHQEEVEKRQSTKPSDS
jgi:hypothetical protein